MSENAEQCVLPVNLKLHMIMLQVSFTKDSPKIAKKKSTLKVWTEKAEYTLCFVQSPYSKNTHIAIITLVTVLSLQNKAIVCEVTIYLSYLKPF